MTYKTLLLTTLFAVASNAGANEIMFTVEKAGRDGSSALAFDIVSDGSVTGFNFSVDLGSATEKSVDTSSCIADLPKHFSGGCRVTKGKLNVIAYSDIPGQFLPAGVTSVGFVTVSGLDKHASMQISNLSLVNDSGNELAVRPKFSGDSRVSPLEKVR